MEDEIHEYFINCSCVYCEQITTLRSINENLAEIKQKLKKWH